MKLLICVSLAEASKMIISANVVYENIPSYSNSLPERPYYLTLLPSAKKQTGEQS